MFFAGGTPERGAKKWGIFVSARVYADWTRPSADRAAKFRHGFASSCQIGQSGVIVIQGSHE
jgi:hypothetical protein